MFTIFLQAKTQGSSWETFALFGVVMVVFYFFMIRPQQKKANDQKKFREAIKKGDSIITIGGLHGKIFSVESDNTIVVEVDKGVRLTFEKSSISSDATKKVQKATA